MLSNYCLYCMLNIYRPERVDETRVVVGSDGSFHAGLISTVSVSTKPTRRWTFKVNVRHMSDQTIINDNH